MAKHSPDVKYLKVFVTVNRNKVWSGEASLGCPKSPHRNLFNIELPSHISQARQGRIQMVLEAGIPVWASKLTAQFIEKNYITKPDFWQ